MQKVGTKLHETGDYRFTYPMVKYDSDGWADASKYHPIDFDLLYLKIEGKKGTFRGWCSGNRWDGSKLECKDKILYWKRSTCDEEKY
jgi:hypothetical protein